MALIRCLKNGAVFIINGGTVLVMLSEALATNMANGTTMTSRTTNGSECRTPIISDSIVQMLCDLSNRCGSYRNSSMFSGRLSKTANSSELLSTSRALLAVS